MTQIMCVKCGKEIPRGQTCLTEIATQNHQHLVCPKLNSTDVVPFERLVFGKLEIYTNGSGEIFIDNAGVVIRVSDRADQLQITAPNCRMSPWAVNGLPAFVVSK